MRELVSIILNHIQYFIYTKEAFLDLPYTRISGFWLSSQTGLFYKSINDAKINKNGFTIGDWLRG